MGAVESFSQAEARHRFLLQFHEIIIFPSPQQGGKGQWKIKRREGSTYRIWVFWILSSPWSSRFLCFGLNSEKQCSASNRGMKAPVTA